MMDNQEIIVAVSLYGSNADDQPDPIVLRPEDESWRHFSTLMLSLYKSPPSAVYIKYLDDEKDWIDMGSEVEFSEALRMTRSTGEILQVRLYPRQDSASVTVQDPFKWIPTTDLQYESDERLVYPTPSAPSAPATQGVMVTSVGGTQYSDAPASQPWLVYPHPNTQLQLQHNTQYQPQNNTTYQPQHNTHQPQNNSKPQTQAHQAAIHDTMKTQTPMRQLSHSNDSIKDDKPELTDSSRPVVAPRASTQTAGNKTTLLAAATVWQNASKLPPQEKVKFLKSLMSGNDENSKSFTERTKEQEYNVNSNGKSLKSSDNTNVDSLLKEFGEEQKVENSTRERIWEGHDIQLAPPRGQDPFEVDTANVMDHAQLLSEMDNSPTLTPTKISEPLKIDNSNSNQQQKEVETPSAFKFAGLSSLSFDKGLPPKQERFHRASSEPVAITVNHENIQVTSAANVRNDNIILSNSKLSHKESSKVKKSKESVILVDANPVCKVPAAKPPVPLPRAMLMMEGAPCGANAVAIEMPVETEFSKVDLGVEVAASGGAASEETGEIMAREGDAAAVSSQMKAAEERDCGAGAVVSWDTSPVLQVEVQSHKHRKEKSPEKKKKSKDGKSEKKPLKKKSEGEKKKEDKDKKKEEKKKKEGEKTKKDDEKEKKKLPKDENRVKLTEDVESGEKVRVRGDAALQYNDFVKYMKKMKKEMHASIVQDMSQETYRILQTGLFSLAQAGLNPLKDLYHEGVKHVGIYCDHCNDRIKGIRYKCGNCLDFDLCERCEGIPNLHDPTHVFLKLRQPARYAGCGPAGEARQEHCLLKENIYDVEGMYKSNPGTPVDLSIRSTEEKLGCKNESPESNMSSEQASSSKQVTSSKKEELSEKEKRQYQEYRDLLVRCTEQTREQQLVGHLGGSSETLNSSSFDLTMARGIDSGMSKIGQEAEERLVAHTGMISSGPLRQRYRDQDTTATRTSMDRCSDSSSGSISFVQLPASSDTSNPTLSSQEACDASPSVLEAHLAKPDNATEAPPYTSPTQASSLPESIPLIPLRASTPRADPVIPLTTPTLESTVKIALPASNPLTKINTEPLPTSTPPEATLMIPLQASNLPTNTPTEPLPTSAPPLMVPLPTSTLPTSKPTDLLNSPTLPDVTPMVPLTAPTLSTIPVSDATQSASTPLVPLVAATPCDNVLPMVPLVAAVPALTLNSDETDKEEAVTATQEADEQEEARGGVDSDSDGFVIENGLSSSDDGDDDEDYESDCDENKNKTSHLQLVWDSDSSDDFCIIDPGNVALIPEGFELLPDSRNLAAVLTQSQTVTCDSDDDATPNACAAPSYEQVMSGSVEVPNTQGIEDKENMSTTVKGAEEKQVFEVAVDPEETIPLIPLGIALTQQSTEMPPAAINAEVEREERFVDAESVPALTTAEDVDQQGEILTPSAPVVEVAGSDQQGEMLTPSDPMVEASGGEEEGVKEAQVTMNTGADSGLIHTMSESEKNRLLELLKMEMGRDLIMEARRAEAEFRNRELELIGQHAERRKEEAREETHSSSTASLAGSARSQNLSRSTSVASSIGAGPLNEADGKFSRSSSVASSSTRDADCQTVPASFGPDQPSASHIIQNVATGVSKAATTAFLTAKDVFHALQAKQNDWKAPASNYKPPQSQWKPPVDTYKPPLSTYKPKESTYRPPEDTYKPKENTYKPPRDYDDYSDFVSPSSNWTPPQSTFIPPNIEWVVEGARADRDTSARNSGQISEAPAGSVNFPIAGNFNSPSTGSVNFPNTDEALSAASEQQQQQAGGTPNIPDAESTNVDEVLEADRLQREGMKRLVEMGFANREENKHLLTQYNGDLSKVIQALVEGKANWAENRH